MNQIEPSDLHTMSFGELKGLPSKVSASVTILPLCSVRLMRRVTACDWCRTRRLCPVQWDESAYWHSERCAKSHACLQ